MAEGLGVATAVAHHIDGDVALMHPAAPRESSGMKVLAVVAQEGDQPAADVVKVLCAAML
jgi:hypothetical protein